MEDDGTFTYTPPLGFTGMDEFDYTFMTAGGAETGTVSLNVDGPIIWFVDENAPDGGDGRFSSPFNNLGPLAGATGPSDAIFLSGDGDTSYDGPLELKDMQVLLGEGTDVGDALGITLSSRSLWNQGDFNGDQPATKEDLGI